ncbi:MAG: nuclear transport factor 2 family protein [Acidimicrobiaceae bacterium]|nr:nuclear transport factor 2 family protein [Acidimicrobiaceae bacterium]
MSDHDEIRKTFAQFCQFLDDRQFEDWAGLFTEDGVFNQLKGRAAVLDMISHAELASEPGLSRKHVIVNAIIDVDGDEARSVSDLVMYDRRGDSAWTVKIGKYTDRLVRRGDRWLLADRQLRMV